MKKISIARYSPLVTLVPLPDGNTEPRSRPKVTSKKRTFFFLLCLLIRAQGCLTWPANHSWRARDMDSTIGLRTLRYLHMPGLCLGELLFSFPDEEIEAGWCLWNRARAGSQLTILPGPVPPNPLPISSSRDAWNLHLLWWGGQRRLGLSTWVALDSQEERWTLHRARATAASLLP